MKFLSDPNLFMYIITVLFALSALRHSFGADWWQACYSLAAVMLNVAVINMGGK